MDGWGSNNRKSQANINLEYTVTGNPDFLPYSQIILAHFRRRLNSIGITEVV